jgi:DNA ligase-1
LSNLHLAARSDDSFVMVGKTFKGLTDAVLEWQTRELFARAIDDDGFLVRVRPDLVVEIALDGVQASSRYPGGVALRFARVRAYRADKSAAEADHISTVQAMLNH